MKRTSLTIFISFFFIAVNAQGLKRTFDDCIGIKNYKVFFNDTIIIKCDSLLLMNQFTFNKYSTAYDRLKNNNGSTIEVFHRYDTLIADQQIRIMQKSEEYGKLKFEYDSLSRHTNNIVSKTLADLDFVKTTLDSTSKNLTDTKVLLSDAQDKIRNEKYQRLKSKFTWGVGGLGLGFGFSALFFLLYQ